MQFVSEYIAAHRGRAVLLQVAAEAAANGDGCRRTPLLTFHGSLGAVKTGRLLEILNCRVQAVLHGNSDHGLSQATAQEITYGMWEASGCTYRASVIEEDLLNLPAIDASLQTPLTDTRPCSPPDSCPVCSFHRLGNFVLAYLNDPGIFLAIVNPTVVKAAALLWSETNHPDGHAWHPAPLQGVALVLRKGDITGRVFSPNLTFYPEGD